MTRAASILVVVWAASALVFGAVGLVAAPWELGVAFGAAGLGASVLNQYRFLRGVEAGVGLLFLVLRRDVLADRRLGLLFVAVAGLGALGRALGAVLDGPPAAWMWGLFALEAAAAAAVAAHHAGRR
ncbi:DUF4345 family protein [Rubrivirga sp. IMCC45206]|uniref:DUF4345 family protein n=1 Tax=Rubrivirga sp. IMCC45206 TaxID=3391614 RepID=UPI00398FE67C